MQFIVVLLIRVTFWSTERVIVLFSSLVFMIVLLVMLAPTPVDRSIVEELIWL